MPSLTTHNAATRSGGAFRLGFFQYWDVEFFGFGRIRARVGASLLLVVFLLTEPDTLRRAAF